MAEESEPDAEAQFSALLEGLRATLPGVEVLFAFVHLPFTGLPRRHVRHVRVGAYLGLAGSVAASVALVASAWLAVGVVHGNAIAMSFAILIAVLVAWTWFWIPLVSFRSDR